MALDLRGYNLSDKPEGVDNYKMDKLVGDVAAVLDHFKQKKMVLVGHDWGGGIAWSFAMTHPDKVDRLVILNSPHPSGLSPSLPTTPINRKTANTRNFQKPDAAKFVTPEMLVFWVKEPEAKKIYLEALGRSSMEGMLNYYKANYFREPYQALTKLPQIKCPVLMIYGLDDAALLPAALNDTWKWIDNELTIVALPGAGHFVHRDKPEIVTKKMVWWLTQP